MDLLNTGIDLPKIHRGLVVPAHRDQFSSGGACPQLARLMHGPEGRGGLLPYGRGSPMRVSHRGLMTVIGRRWMLSG